MHRVLDYRSRIDEPLVTLGTYRLQKHYREAAHDRLIDLARIAPPTERPILPILAKRAGARLHAWYTKRIYGPQTRKTAKQIPAQIASTECWD